MLKQSKVLLIAAFTLVFSVVSFQEAMAGAGPQNFPVQYSVKYVCGYVAPQSQEPPVKPGNYASAINIHNPYGENVDGAKRVALHYREDASAPPIPVHKNFKVLRRRVLEIDCIDIWSIVEVAPGTFLKAMVHIGLDQKLPVAAVYTSQTNLSGETPDPIAGISIDVEYVEPFFESFPVN